MGASMAAPVTEKDSECAGPGGALRLQWASCGMQGWRNNMEDAHICLPSLHAVAAKAGAGGQGGALPWTAGWSDLALFGVLDGHGGEQVAKYSERHLPPVLCSFPINVTSTGHSADDIGAAFRGTFHRIDDLLRDRGNSLPELRALSNKKKPGAPGGYPSPPVDPNNVGCTACFCCITDQHIICANAGDSRAVLCRSGKAVALSEDHKPNDDGERKRIQAAGGFLDNSTQCWRVNGNLNLSRALGDLEYKKNTKLKPEEQIICSTPDIHVEERCSNDEFVVICCDGVWDRKTNQQVVDFVRARMPSDRDIKPEQMSGILEALLDDCLSPNLQATEGLGGDNMTAVLVCFQEEPPRLASVETGPASAQGGALHAVVELPKGCSLSDLDVFICEETAAIHVGVRSSKEKMSKLMSLQKHLPEGALPGFAPGLLAGSTQGRAKFLGKTGQLRVELPWHWPM